MERKINNPFDSEQNKCFGCSPSNHNGLKLEFTEKDDSVEALWVPSAQFQGYPGVLHGGITATLMDETAAWCVYVKAGTAGVTSSMYVKYNQPVYISKGAVRIVASLVSRNERYAEINCRLIDSGNNVCAEADLKYFIYPVDIAIRRFRYPGKDKFFQ